MGGRPLAVSAPGWTHRGYRLLMRVLAPLALAWLWWRGRKDPGYRENLRQRLGHIEPHPASIHGIWVHAASVGEVQAAQALIEELLKHWPAESITVTTQTPTGARALRQQRHGAKLQHFFAPVDTPAATGRFLNRLRPRVVVLIEREVWPEWLLQCRDRAIAVALVNARLSARSAQRYQAWHRIMQPVWQGLHLVTAVDHADAQRFLGLGVPAERLRRIDNLKFDQHMAADTARPAWPLPPQRRLIVAGSTHEGEESALLDAWPDLLQQHPDAVLVIVPRHPERFAAVAQQIQSRGWTLARLSHGETPDATTSVWLGDTMGDLPRWYALASACFIGGTLVPIGGHNPLEAMARGQPVVFGPHTLNATELYSAIEVQHGGVRAADAQAVMQHIGQWLAEPALLAQRGEAARQFVQSQQGNSRRTAQALAALWAPLQPERLPSVAHQGTDADTVWHDPSMLSADQAASIFDTSPDTPTTLIATGSGRGQAERLNISGLDAVRRHYRRGGWVARVNPDRFQRSPACESRAMAEYALLRWMVASGLPVPAPVASRQQRHGKHYTADILVATIPNTRNLVQALVQAPLSTAQWYAAGKAIRQLHDAQVHHSDLNAHNILLDNEGRAWIVDFDKCEVRSGQDWKTHNLQRLQRSLRKEQQRLTGFHWSEDQWPALLGGYAGTSTPAASGEAAH